MINSKYFLLYLALFVLFSSFSPSLAHWKKHASPPPSECCPCNTKVNESNTNTNTKVNEGSTNTQVNQGSTNTKINEGSTNAQVNEGSANTKVNQGSTNTQVNQGSTNTKVNEGNTNTEVNKGSTNTKVNEGSTNTKVNENSTNSHVNEGNGNTKVNQGSTNTQVNQGNTNTKVNESSTNTQVNQGNANTKANQGSTNTQVNQGNANSQVNQGSTSTQVNHFEGSFTKVFAFGDSSTDTGNCLLLGGFKSFVGSFLSNSGLFGSTTSKKSPDRLCDGRLVIDFLCENLGLPPLPPYKATSMNFSHGVNFAISGSTSLSSDFFSGKNVGNMLMWNAPQSFQTQIDWFSKFMLAKNFKMLGSMAPKADMTTTLFWIGDMGLNDYARIFGTAVSPKVLTKLTVNHVCQLLQTSLDNGARFIVVQGLPPAGCQPFSLSSSSDRDQMGCSTSANSVIQAHNELLQTKVAIFQKQFSNCTILYADYFGAYKEILMNPSAYQIQEPFKACCGAGGGQLNFQVQSLCGSSSTTTCKDPSKYISWDGIHLTEAMHGHISDLLLNKGFCKPSFDVMINAQKNCKI